MTYDYKRYFAEIATLHDLTTRPEERTWRLAAPGSDVEPHWRRSTTDASARCAPSKPTGC